MYTRNGVSYICDSPSQSPTCLIPIIFSCVRSTGYPRLFSYSSQAELTLTLLKGMGPPPAMRSNALSHVSLFTDDRRFQVISVPAQPTARNAISSLSTNGESADSRRTDSEALFASSLNQHSTSISRTTEADRSVMDSAAHNLGEYLKRKRSVEDSDEEDTRYQNRSIPSAAENAFLVSRQAERAVPVQSSTKVRVVTFRRREHLLSKSALRSFDSRFPYLAALYSMEIMAALSASLKKLDAVLQANHQATLSSTKKPLLVCVFSVIESKRMTTHSHSVGCRQNPEGSRRPTSKSCWDTGAWYSCFRPVPF